MNFSVVQLVKLTDSPDSLYRMRWPAENLALQKPEWKIVNLDAFADERYEWALHADLLVVFQSRDIDLIPVIRERKKAGRKTIFEVHDNFYDAPSWSPVAKEWSSPLLWQDYERMMIEVDYVQVSSNGLKSLLESKLSLDNIFIAENNLYVNPSIHKADSDILKIGWAGSYGHTADILKIAPVLHKLVRSGLNLEVHLMCNPDIFNLLRSMIAVDGISHHSNGDIDDYFKFLKTLDIGIIPLNATAYNRCRSDIKAIEYSSQGVLPVVQNIETYREFALQTGAPLFSNNDELLSKILICCENHEMRKHLAECCTNYVSVNRSAKNSPGLSAKYEACMPEKPDPFFSNFKTGYSFIEGTQSRILPRKLLEKTIQSCCSDGKHEEALKISRVALKKNPFLTDLALKELEIMYSEKSDQLSECFSEHHLSNPKDLRITLFGLSRGLFSDCLSKWSEVLSMLENDCKLAAFYEKEVVNFVQAEFLKNHDHYMLSRCAAIYPNSVRGRQL